MTDPTPVAPSSSPTPRELFAAEVLLHLPRHAVFEAPSGMKLPTGEPVLEHDTDYDPTALAVFIMAGVDRLVAADAFAAAADEVEALEQSQAEMIQLAGASSTFSAMAEWHSYMSQLVPILKGGLNITEQWDLARTIEAERDRVQAVLLALVDRFPQLQAVLGAEVGRRAQGLVNAQGADLEN